MESYKAFSLMLREYKLHHNFDVMMKCLTAIFIDSEENMKLLRCRCIYCCRPMLCSILSLLFPFHNQLLDGVL